TMRAPCRAPHPAGAGERGGARQCCGGMDLRARPSPALGAMIAVALTAYAAARGRGAPAPAPARSLRRPARKSWFQILSAVGAEMNRDHVSMMAAGVA